MAEVNKRFLTIDDFCRTYSIGKTKTYEEIGAGRLKVIKVGRNVRVPIDAALAWERLMISEAASSDDQQAA